MGESQLKKGWSIPSDMISLQNTNIEHHRNWKIIREEKQFIVKFKKFLNKIHVLEKDVLF